MRCNTKYDILIHADALDNQGAGVHVYLVQFLNHLHKHSNLKCILLRSSKNKNYPKWKEIGIGMSPVALLWKALRMFVCIPYLARKYKVAYVLEPAHFGPFFVPNKAKSITVIHDLSPILFPKFHVFHSAVLQCCFLKRILLTTDIILSNSRSTTSDLLNYLPKEHQKKIYTLPLGRDDFFCRTQEDSALEKYHITSPFFLTVGTIEPRKNHTTILTAFEQFCKEHGTNYQLVIAGGLGWKYSNVLKAIREHSYPDHIRQIGYVSKTELRELYSHATCCVYASVYEGFGFPILESFACETPCVAARNSSLTEVGGDMCIYFETHDAKQLTKKMAEVSGRKADEKVRYKFRRYIEKFSWELYVREFENILTPLDT